MNVKKVTDLKRGNKIAWLDVKKRQTGIVNKVEVMTDETVWVSTLTIGDLLSTRLRVTKFNSEEVVELL